jgi:hypothetical protein
MSVKKKATGAVTIFLVLSGFLAACHEPFQPHIRELRISGLTKTLNIGLGMTDEIEVTVDVPSKIKEVSISWTNNNPGAVKVTNIYCNREKEHYISANNPNGSAEIYVEGIATFNLELTAGNTAGSADITISVEPGGLTTLCNVIVGGGSAPGISVNIPITYEWVNQNGPAFNSVLAAAAPGQKVNITANLTGGYIVYDWIADGVSTGGTSSSYTFSSYDTGPHTVTLLVTKGGQVYTTDVKITVN